MEPKELLAAANTAMIVISGISLIAGRIAIAKSNIDLHKKLMLTATTFAGMFLVVYVIRWGVFGSTKYTGEGVARTIFFAILIGHSILAVAIIPMILTTIRRALRDDRAGHRKIAPWTFAAWLVVVISGWYVFWAINM